MARRAANIGYCITMGGSTGYSPAELDGGNGLDSDPGRLRERIGPATGSLLGTATALSDDQIREPSLLPDWSRGHVLTHLARNADGLRNLLAWAATGVATPQYRSSADRRAAIEAGAGRSAAELAADLEQSAARLDAAAAGLPASAWDAQVRDMLGAAHPAWFVLFRRLTELEVHHVDLGLGYRPADWPRQFVTDMLERVLGDFAERPDVPGCLLVGTDTGRRLQLAAASRRCRPAAVTVSGPERELLAWLLGRDAGSRLSVTGGEHPAAGQDGHPPRLPAWR
jgi:maleylpyruvate isomerase